MFKGQLDSDRLEEGRVGVEGAELSIYRSQPLIPRQKCECSVASDRYGGRRTD